MVRSSLTLSLNVWSPLGGLPPLPHQPLPLFMCFLKREKRQEERTLSPGKRTGLWTTLLLPPEERGFPEFQGRSPQAAGGEAGG